MGRIESLRENPTARGWFKLLRWFLALLFLWPGAEKLSGRVFLRALDEPGLLAFFRALEGAELYWRFIGFSQVVAALMLLWRRSAIWGALLCVPIYANITVLLFALPFDAASRVAGLLFFGLNLVLVAWYLPELRPAPATSPASQGSIRRGWTGAWARRWFRALVLVAVLGWTVLHVLDRLGLIGG